MEFFTDFNCGKQFPMLLRAAGLEVHMHVDHFAPDVDDAVWAPAVAARGVDRDQPGSENHPDRASTRLLSIYLSPLQHLAA
ncbi:MAG: hypothetical protein ACJ8GN_25170 [Longimicrobiaceae bacterium]